MYNFSDVGMNRVDKISDFYFQTGVLFDFMIYQWSEILFPKNHRRLIINAWEKIGGRKARKEREFLFAQYEDIGTFIDDMESDFIGKYETLRAMEASIDSKLEDAGLKGEQLELKLFCLREAWSNFEKFGTVFLLKKVLTWINSILSSLATALPGVDAMLELKEAMENSIDQNEYR